MKPRFKLILEVDDSGTDAATRIAQLVKLASRGLGLRCLTVEPVGEYHEAEGDETQYAALAGCVERV